MQDTLRAITITAFGLFFWEAFIQVVGTPEPWDSPHYLKAYLASVAASGFFGYIFDRRAWLWGLLVIFAQLPVMMLHSTPGPLWFAGVFLLVVYSVPAVCAAMLMARLKAGRAASS